ncbi:MAG: DM13 domain-containing protein [Nitrospirota bacterium]
MNPTQVTVAALVLAFGLASHPARADMMEKGKGMMQDKGMMKDNEMMGAGMSGMLMGAKDHHASGSVALTTDADGHTVLRLENLKVDKVPDGRVYLAKDGDYTKGVELGKLTQFSGTVQYAIPANVNTADYNSVVIWCKKFNVEIGHATFDTGMMKKDGMMMDKDTMHDDTGMMK